MGLGAASIQLGAMAVRPGGRTDLLESPGAGCTDAVDDRQVSGVPGHGEGVGQAPREGKSWEGSRTVMTLASSIGLPEGRVRGGWGVRGGWPVRGATPGLGSWRRRQLRS